MVRRRLNDEAVVDTDRLTEELEKALKELYEDSRNGLVAYHNEFLRRFGKNYAEGQAKVESGEISKQQFQSWINSQIGQDDRWQSMVDEMTGKIMNANKEACNMINDVTPGIYANNYNYSLYSIDQYCSGVAWNLVDESTIRELVLGGNHTDFQVSDGNGGYTFRRYMTPEENAKVDYNWNSQQIQRRLTAGILQGKSALGIANDFYEVMGNNYKAAVRNARTAITSAQNSGRMASYEQAAKMGIKVEKEWMATLDERTRESHQDIDGEVVPYKDHFSNGLEYPADPDGEPAEVYNCRCTMRAVFPNTPYRTSRVTYNEWKQKQSIVFPSYTIAPRKEPLQIEYDEADYRRRRIPVSLGSNNMFNSNDDMHDRVKKVKPLEGYDDVFIHGNEYGFEFRDIDGNASEVLPEELAILLKGLNLENDKIRLCSCGTGGGVAEAAQRLADSSGKEVLAPTKTLWIDENGGMWICGEVVSIAGITLPDYNDVGEWKTFYPRKG